MKEKIKIYKVCKGGRARARRAQVRAAVRSIEAADR